MGRDSSSLEMSENQTALEVEAVRLLGYQGLSTSLSPQFYTGQISDFFLIV